jgi:hypothetical protein
VTNCEATTQTFEEKAYGVKLDSAQNRVFLCFCPFATFKLVVGHNLTKKKLLAVLLYEHADTRIRRAQCTRDPVLLIIAIVLVSSLRLLVLLRKKEQVKRLAEKKRKKKREGRRGWVCLLPAFATR